MTNKLLVSLSKAEGFMSLQIYPNEAIFAINKPRFDTKLFHFIRFQKSLSAKYRKLGIRNWTNNKYDMRYEMRYEIDFSTETTMNDLSAIEYVRKLDIPLVMFGNMSDNNIVVYSTNQGIYIISNFFSQNPSYSKDDINIVIV